MKDSNHKVLLNTSWNKDDKMICCCPYKFPRCNKFKTCELLEVSINTYDGIEKAFENVEKKCIKTYKDF